jgi:hypothetical protein
MLADWKAATERMADGDLAKSLEIQRERFGLSDQLVAILRNTAQAYGWVGLKLCRATGHAPNGDHLDCNQVAGHDLPHCDGSRDNLCWNGTEAAWL